MDDVPKDAEVAFQALKGLVHEVHVGVGNAGHYSSLAVHDIGSVMNKALMVLSVIRSKV